MYAKLSQHIDMTNENYKSDEKYQKLLTGLTKKR